MVAVARTVFVPKGDVLSLCFAFVLDTDGAALRREVGGHFYRDDSQRWTSVRGDSSPDMRWV